MTKYHLGCGRKYLNGYVNVDHNRPGIKVDIDADLLSFAPVNATEIRSHHVFEHFSYPESFHLLINWTFNLTQGCLLIIDIPDIEMICKHLSDRSAYTHFGVVRLLFGDQAEPWAFHKCGWTKDMLTTVLTDFGFSIEHVKRYNNSTKNFPNMGMMVTSKKVSTIPEKQLIDYTISYLSMFSNGQFVVLESYVRRLNELRDRFIPFKSTTINLSGLR